MREDNSLYGRIHPSWINTIDANEYVRIMRTLFHSYSEIDLNQNYNMYTNGAGEFIRLFPRPQHILKPFRMITPDYIRVILLAPEPSSRGTATGIPFWYNRGFMGTANGKYDYIDVIEVAAIIDAIATEKTDPLAYFDNLINVPSWYEQGVLVMHSIWTCDSESEKQHKYLWYEFIANLVESIANMNQNILLAGLGNDAEEILDSLNVNNKIVTSPFGDMTDELDYVEFKSENIFIHINDIIEYETNIGPTIDW